MRVAEFPFLECWCENLNNMAVFVTFSYVCFNSVSFVWDFIFIFFFAEKKRRQDNFFHLKEFRMLNNCQFSVNDFSRFSRRTVLCCAHKRTGLRIFCCELSNFFIIFFSHFARFCVKWWLSSFFHSQLWVGSKFFYAFAEVK